MSPIQIQSTVRSERGKTKAKPAHGPYFGFALCDYRVLREKPPMGGICRRFGGKTGACAVLDECSVASTGRSPRANPVTITKAQYALLQKVFHPDPEHDTATPERKRQLLDAAQVFYGIKFNVPGRKEKPKASR